MTPRLEIFRNALIIQLSVNESLCDPYALVYLQRALVPITGDGTAFLAQNIASLRGYVPSYPVHNSESGILNTSAFWSHTGILQS
jgi:hypothetical protein